MKQSPRVNRPPMQASFHKHLLDLSLRLVKRYFYVATQGCAVLITGAMFFGCSNQIGSEENLESTLSKEVPGSYKFETQISPSILKRTNAVQELLEASRSTNARVRAASARVLAKNGSDEAVSRLSEMVGDQEIYPHIYAAIISSGNEHAQSILLDHLRKIVASSDEGSKVWEVSVIWIAKINATEVKEKLAAIIRSSQSTERRAMAKKLNLQANEDDL